MGNRCPNRVRAAWDPESYYRELLERQEQEKLDAERTAKEEEERERKQEEEIAAITAEARKKIDDETRSVCKALILKMIADQEIASLEKTQAFAEKQTASLRADFEECIAKITGLEAELVHKCFPELQERVTGMARDQLDFITQEYFDKVRLDLELDLEKSAGDLADRIHELWKEQKVLKNEAEQQREHGETNYQEAKMLISTLESELRSTTALLQVLQERVTILELECVPVVDQHSEAETMSLASSATGAAGAGEKRTTHPPPLPPLFENDSSKANSGTNNADSTKQPPLPDESSDSSEGEFTIPYTTGKLGVNAVELIDWSKLRLVRKKEKQTLNEIDKIKMRRLTSPPLRSQIKSWKRWKESIFYWVRDLRRVRVPFTVMGAQVLEQAFVGCDGEHAVAEQASATRDIIAMMEKLDLKFATPTRGMLEKLEEWIPLITRDDGVSPQLFLHLLGMIFEGEKRLGASHRTEHNKVTRALAALRVHNDKDTIIRSQLTSDMNEMTYAELEHTIDALAINDTTRYDARGLKPEKNTKGTPDYLSDLLGILGDRHGEGASLDHVALNKFFSGPSAQGHVFATGGAAGGVGGNRGGGTTSQPGTPRAPRQQPSKEQTEKEDQAHWEKHEKKSVDQKKTELAERMEKLKKQNDKENYWCPHGDWCQRLRTTGYCPLQHMRAEYWRGKRRFARDFPEKHAEFEKKKRDQQSKEAKDRQAKAKAGAAPDS
eukprot:g18278.t1